MSRFTRTGLAFSLVLVCALIPLPAPGQETNTLLMDGGTVNDGNSGQPVSDTVILIRGNKIAAIGRLLRPRQTGRLQQGASDCEFQILSAQ